MKKLLLIIFLISLTFSLTAVDTGKYNYKGKIFASYILVQKALAADDSIATKNAFSELAQNSKGDIKSLSEKALNAKELAGMRAQFKEISKMMAKVENPEGYGTAYCPMAKAWWVQKEGDIKNPYYGRKMLSCGSFKEFKTEGIQEGHKH